MKTALELISGAQNIFRELSKSFVQQQKENTHRYMYLIKHLLLASLNNVLNIHC